MTKTATMRRRTFLGAIAGGVVSGTAAIGEGGREGNHRALQDAAAIGREILAAGLMPPDEKQLRAALGLGDAPVATLFDKRWTPAIRRDFASGETVYVAGWTLSRTEARICVLASIACPQEMA